MHVTSYDHDAAHLEVSFLHCTFTWRIEFSSLFIPDNSIDKQLFLFRATCYCFQCVLQIIHHNIIRIFFRAHEFLEADEKVWSRERKSEKLILKWKQQHLLNAKSLNNIQSCWYNYSGKIVYEQKKDLSKSFVIHRANRTLTIGVFKSETYGWSMHSHMYTCSWTWKCIYSSESRKRCKTGERGGGS